jgi:hypothetical protein
MAQGLFRTKVKIALAALLVGAGLLAGTGALVLQNRAQTPGEPAAGAGEPVPAEADRPRPPAWQPARRGQRVAATVETSLSTAPGQVRQFAFDGKADTFFASAQDAGRDDHFTLVFDEPVAVTSVAVATGRPQGGQQLDAGVLEVSADGHRFEELAPFADGAARGQPEGRWVQAVRVRSTINLKHSLAVREFTIESDPPVQVFKYPIEFVADASNVPEMREWLEKAARVCERAYPLINEELPGPGFKPGRVITIGLTTNYDEARLAQAVGGGRITGSAPWFKEHPDDVGALVHTTVYFVQRYPFGWNPPWLEQGVADYVRFFKFEPGKLPPRDPDRARYDGGYKDTAAFLAYLTQKYDHHIVRKINQVLREGEFREEIFQELTGKTVQQLGEEWRDSLRPNPTTRSRSAR